MDGHKNKDAGSDLGSEVTNNPGAIFTPQEQLIEVEETTPTISTPEQIQPVPVRSNVTMPSGVGDIKLSNQKTSSKKPLVILLVIIIIATIIGLLVFAVIRSSPLGGQLSANSDAKKKFDQYASYILYGETSSGLSGEYDRLRYYKLSEEFSSNPMDVEFWNEARVLLASAVETYSGLGKLADSDLADLLLEYQRTFLFVANYKSLGEPPEDRLIGVLLESGIDAAKNYVSSYYKGLSEHAQPATADIPGQLVTQYQSYAELLDFSNSHGCIVNAELDLSCAETAIDDNSANISNILQAYDEAAEVSRNSVYAIVQELERRCWSISHEFSINE